MIVHILHHGLVLCGEKLGPGHKWTHLDDVEHVTCERCARVIEDINDKLEELREENLAELEASKRPKLSVKNITALKDCERKWGMKNFKRGPVYTGDVAGRKAHEKLAEAAVLAHRAGWDEKKFQDEAFGYFDAAKEGKDDDSDRNESDS